MKIDKEYRNMIHLSVMDAIVHASMLVDGKNAILRSGEIADVMLDVIVMMAAGSDETASPTKRRVFVDKFSKKLLHRLTAFQADVATHGWPGGMQNVTQKDVN